MGKQSARMYYHGHDHTDIICPITFREGVGSLGDFRNHYKIYKGNELVWKREVPKYIFCTNSTIYTTDKMKTFSGFILYDCRNGEKVTYPNGIEFLSGYFFMTAERKDIATGDTYYGIFSSINGYEWKTVISSMNEQYASVEKYGNALYIATSERILKIVVSNGGPLVITLINYVDVLKGREWFGVPSILSGNGYLIIPIPTGKVTKPVGSISITIAAIHTIVSCNLETETAEIVATNLPYSITSYLGGCYYDGYFYLCFGNGEETRFGGNPKSLIRRTKDGYAWETYTPTMYNTSSRQLLGANGYLYISYGQGSISRTIDGVVIETTSHKGITGKILFADNTFFTSSSDEKLLFSKDIFKDAWEVARTIFGRTYNLVNFACSDNGII